MEFKLEKGGLIWVDTCWYVIVHILVSDGKVWIQCICDNANNSYTWKPEDLSVALSSREAMWISTFRVEPSWFSDHPNVSDFRERKIPADVVAEVLTGLHDDRWS